ncbi:MAG: bifunctional phosphopantothenoylcysteine decarboxylase/phosphopantothenate--cysteine ligase CoaBC [Helicobacter sp.]|nr:bifunctional phosphopantothenoylcysteine decarboxylase/phosphopantothenate--cysteine ligase CoaBC [Helicobacter sp.]
MVLDEITPDFLISSQILHKKRILLFVTGSISAYKMLDLISFLKKCGSSVQVAMSDSAMKFINPLSFEALTHNHVLTEKSESWTSEANTTNGVGGDFNKSLNHISISRTSDLALIAPASANTIAKIAHGIADNVLLSAILALPNIPKLLAPAMNTNMLNAPQTQKNLDILQQMDFQIIPSKVGMLACDTKGDGALADLSELIFGICKALFRPKSSDLMRLKPRVIITGGSCSESIDLVREISNASSGLQASALALIAHFSGFEVTFISSKYPLKLPKDIIKVQAKTNEDFKEALELAIKQNTARNGQKMLLFMCAAISDFAPIKQDIKVKKEDLDEINIKCFKKPDILSEINSPDLIKIGFKAEFDKENALESAKKALKNKNCHAICLNIIGNKNAFGSSLNEIYVIKNDEIIKLELSHKMQIAKHIFESI